MCCVQPGYLRPLLPAAAPSKPEPWAAIKHDFWEKVVTGTQDGLEDASHVDDLLADCAPQDPAGPLPMMAHHLEVAEAAKKALQPFSSVFPWLAAFPCCTLHA